MAILACSKHSDIEREVSRDELGTTWFKTGFHLRRSRSRNQKRRTELFCKNSILIPLSTPSFTITRLGDVHSDWFVLPRLLPTSTNWKKMETFWFSLLRFLCSYDFAYDSDFCYDSNSYSVASKNQLLVNWSWRCQQPGGRGGWGGLHSF